jgi:hypothetical protein
VADGPGPKFRNRFYVLECESQALQREIITLAQRFALTDLLTELGPRLDRSIAESVTEALQDAGKSEDASTLIDSHIAATNGGQQEGGAA